MISHFLESHFKSSCILFMLWLSLNLFCYLGTAGIWEWVEADPLSECPGLNLLSLQPEDGPDCLLQVLAGEAGSCTSVEQVMVMQIYVNVYWYQVNTEWRKVVITVSVYMYDHCVWKVLLWHNQWLFTYRMKKIPSIQYFGTWTRIMVKYNTFREFTQNNLCKMHVPSPRAGMTMTVC